MHTQTQQKAPLASLRFDNRFVQELPADPVTENTRRQVYSSCYSRVLPTRVSSPRLIAFSPEAASLLGLSPAECRSTIFTQVFSGNRLLPGMDPYAACYGGHQFGNWAGQLGDGRAINLGEVVNTAGEHWTLQLKGAGPTPYSRTADGLAVLRSSVREFLCSEAMYHLGIPTTRALSLIVTGDMVERDMFYNGNPREEQGAIVCRMAPSFIRFGNFELLAARNELTLLRQLADFTIRTAFPHLDASAPDRYLRWLSEMCTTTAELMVHWLRVGFVHGVMNTDNMSILGLTLDYGPYGWLEDFDPMWTPNTTDSVGHRYCYGRQAQVALWNVTRLAEALSPLINDIEALNEALRGYSALFAMRWEQMMASKLGLRHEQPGKHRQLIHELLQILPLVETDMTIFFRLLANIPGNTVLSARTNEEVIAPLLPAYYHQERLSTDYINRLTSWLASYQQQVRDDNISDEVRRRQMKSVNPKYVLRNYLAQLAIDKAEQNDFTFIEELQEVLRAPYDEQPDKEHFAEKRPEWARHRPGCSMLSCSS